MYVPYLNNRHNRFLFTTLATGMNEYDSGHKIVYLATIFTSRKQNSTNYDDAFEWWIQLEEVKHMYEREIETRDAEDYLKSQL